MCPKLDEAPDPQPARPILPELVCTKCGHTWHPRRSRRPAVCPRCKTRKWDQPRKRSDLPPEKQKLVDLVVEFARVAEPGVLRHAIKLMEAAIELGRHRAPRE